MTDLSILRKIAVRCEHLRAVFGKIPLFFGGEQLFLSDCRLVHNGYRGRLLFDRFVFVLLSGVLLNGSSAVVFFLLCQIAFVAVLS